MQSRELNCATIEVANNRDISGRATADEMNPGLRIGKGRKLWRIACLAGLFFVLAPLRGHAQTRITSLPYTITTSGTYVLDGSLDYNSSSAVAIQINASNVTVDLNGNSINNLGAGPATPAVVINAFNNPNETIKNFPIVLFFNT